MKMPDSVEVIMKIDMVLQANNEICAHAIKVADLVRCKDCVHANNAWYECDLLHHWISGDDYCSRGERKS